MAHKESRLETTNTWFLCRMLITPWTAKKSNVQVMQEASSQGHVINSISAQDNHNFLLYSEGGRRRRRLWQSGMSRVLKKRFTDGENVAWIGKLARKTVMVELQNNTEAVRLINNTKNIVCSSRYMLMMIIISIYTLHIRESWQHHLEMHWVADCVPQHEKQLC